MKLRFLIPSAALILTALSLPWARAESPGSSWGMPLPPPAVATPAPAATGSISGYASFEGKRIFNRTIQLVKLGVGPSKTIDGAIDGTSHYQFDGLAPGDYGLSLLTEYQSRPAAVLTRAVKLAENEQLRIDFGADMGRSALFGTVFRDNKPVPGALVIAGASGNGCDYPYFSAVTNENGEYRMLGMQPGPYNSMVIEPVPPGQAAKPLKDTGIVEVEDELTNRNFHLGGGYSVKAHLIFPPDFPLSIRAALARASLAAVPSGIPSFPLNPLGIDRVVGSELHGDQIEIPGRLKGQYRLQFMLPENQWSQRIVPTECLFVIDNLESDVDLGDVRINSFGRLHVKIEWPAGLDLPKPPFLSLQSADRPERRTYFFSSRFDGSKDDVILEGIRPGPYAFRLGGQGVAGDPETIATTVTLAQPAEIVFQMRATPKPALGRAGNPMPGSPASINSSNAPPE